MIKIKLLFLATSLLLQAQTDTSDFSLLFDKKYPNKLSDVVQNYDRTLSAVGISRSFQATAQSSSQSYNDAFAYLRSQANQYGSRIHLITIDKDANILTDRSYPLEKFQEPQSLLKTPDNGYFVGGTTQDGKLLLLRLDANAHILYSKEFGTQNNDTLAKLIALKDGGVLALASSVTTRDNYSDMFEMGLGDNDISLTRFSKNGTLLWSKKYGTKGNDYGVDALEAEDGSIVLVGNSQQEGQKQILLSKLTEHGDKIWLQTYQSQEEITPYKLTLRRNKNILLSSSLKNAQGKKQVKLLLIASDGSILKEKIISTNYSSKLYDIKELANGHIVAVGDVRDNENTDALFMHLDQDLELVCQEHYGDASYDSFHALSILHNSRIAAVGEFTPPQSQEEQMWLVKINPDCTLAQKSKQTDTIHEELVDLFATERRDHQLTIKEDLSFDLSNIELYFKVGEYILTPKQKEFLDSFAPKLIAWMYKHRESIASFEINGHTSSEWGDVNFTQRYLKNEKLSLNRSFATLSYLFLQQERKVQEWLSEVLRGSGYSYAKKRKIGHEEDKEHSRRVSFKIILK